jgi:AraC-like DNA-binding protein
MSVDDLGIDWGVGARRYEYHLSQCPVYAEVTTAEDGVNFSYDYHQGIEFGLVLSGRVTRIWDDYSRQAEPGDVWLSAMWEPHGTRDPFPGTECLIVSFLPEFIGDACSEDLELLTVLATPSRDRPYVSSDEQRRRILSWGQHMRHEIEQKPPKWMTSIKLSLVQILFDVSRTWRAPVSRQSDPGSPGTSLGRIMPAVDLLRERGPAFVGVEEASRACSMSRTTFNRLFQHVMGVSFGRFRIRSQLAYAANRLLTTDLTTNRIALDAGFSDGSHFHRAFLKHYGQTPGQYRTGRQSA